MINLAKTPPALVSLAKTAKVSLDKAGIDRSHKARVALLLDISGSMGGLFQSGKVQTLINRVLALACNLDDDAAIDVWLFNTSAHAQGQLEAMDFASAGPKYAAKVQGGTNYAPALNAVRSHYFGGTTRRTAAFHADQPVYCMFVTDGQPQDEQQAEQTLREAAYEPMFVQFMGIGKSSKHRPAPTGGLMSRLFGKQAAPDTDFPFLEKLDEMSGRFVDNANFFSVLDPAGVSDEELYDLMLAEYPAWLKLAQAKGMLPASVQQPRA